MPGPQPTPEYEVPLPGTGNLAGAEVTFRALLEATPDALVVHGSDGRIRIVNAQTESLFGYAREELIGAPVEQLMPERFRERHAGHLAHYLAAPQVRPMGAGLDLFARRKDGSEFPVEISLSPFQTNEGLLITSSIRDVSERKRILEALRESEEGERRKGEQLALANARWRLLSETAGGLLESADPVRVVHDMFARMAEHAGVDGYVHYRLSDAGDELLLESQFGFSGACMPPVRLALGEGVSGVVAARRASLYVPNAQSNEEGWTQLIRDQGIHAGVCNPLLAGERLLGTLGFASRSRDHFAPDELELFATVSHYLAIAMERQRLLERERRKSEQMALAIREAHHRIKNNLQAITDLLSLEVSSVEDAASAEPLRDSIERIGTIALVHDFLSRDEDLEHVEVDRVIERLVPMALRSNGAAGKSVDLAIDAEPLSLPSKQATALALVVNELVSNAAKHAFAARRNGKLRVGLRQDGGEGQLLVQDDGPGLPPRFRRVLSRQRRAPGFAHSVANQPARLADLLAFVGSPRGSPFPAPSGKRGLMPLRLLICDDEGLTALRYRATVKRLGYETVGTAANGVQVVEAALRLKPDVILMDIEMPHLNGIEATRRIMEAAPTAIIIMSAYGETETVTAAMTAGASGYLIKPITDEQIRPAIESALERFAARC